jgi:hypothetical protein
MKIYKVNINGDFKVKREIDMNNYILWECLGSSGLTLKHKKNGKKLFLATKEFFVHWKESYIIAVKNIGKSYHYIYDENRKTIKDEKGSPIRIYSTKEEAELIKKEFLSTSYIQFEDFTILADLYFKQ